MATQVLQLKKQLIHSFIKKTFHDTNMSGYARIDWNMYAYAAPVRSGRIAASGHMLPTALKNKQTNK